MFLSIKGIYYQAEVLGQPITWITPYAFAHDVSTWGEPRGSHQYPWGSPGITKGLSCGTWDTDHGAWQQRHVGTQPPVTLGCPEAACTSLPSSLCPQSYQPLTINLWEPDWWSKGKR